MGGAVRIVLVGLVALAAAMVAVPLAGAQSVTDYGNLFGLGASEPAQSAPAGPERTLPRSTFDPDSVPDPAAYGQLDPLQNAGVLQATQHLVDVFRARLVSLIHEAPDALDELHVTLSAASPTGRPGYFIGVAIFALFLLAVGRAFTTLFAAYIARPFFVGLQKARPVGYAEKLPVLVSRVIITIVGSVIAVATASAVGLFFHQGHEATLNTAIVIFGAYAAIMMADTIWRMMLCPFLPNYRIPVIETSGARRLYRWLTYVSGFGIMSIAFGYWVRALGLPRELHVVFALALSALTVLGLLIALRTNRRTIDAIILAGRERLEISWVSLLSLSLWWPIAAVYMVATWGKLAFDLVMGVDAEPIGLMAPYLVMLGGISIYAIACYAIERIFARSRRRRELNSGHTVSAEAERDEDMRPAVDAPHAPGDHVPQPQPDSTPGTASPDEEREWREALAAEAYAGEKGPDGDVDPGPDSDIDGEGGGPVPVATDSNLAQLMRPSRGMQSFEELALRVASLFAIGAAAYGLLYYWGGAWLFQETMFLGMAEDLVDICFIGYVLFHAVRIWIDCKIQEEGVDDTPGEPLEGEGGGAGATRLATLLPLIRSFVLGLILIAILLVVAAELGVNVAPLFAGAGILGLAIGFGSQTLVRDVLSGAFFLMDDAFRRGEYIDVGEVKGTVEKISIRSFQLRHHLGMLHTIPFGEIKHLTNFSRDWVMMKLPLRLTYDTDVEKVRKLVKKLGISLLDDPVIGSKFIQPLKSQGVIEMQDSAMIVRVKFMTRPGEQWVLRKRIFQEIRDLFEREGIKFAHREVTVRIPDLPNDRQITDAERHAVGSAARNALDVVEGEATLATGTGGRMDDR